MKVVELRCFEDPSRRRFAHYCLGCQDVHVFYCGGASGKGPSWAYNGIPEAATVSPSVKHSWGRGGGGRECCCHYFIRDGKIVYCTDSTHDLAGREMLLPDIPEEALRIYTD